MLSENYSANVLSNKQQNLSWQTGVFLLLGITLLSTLIGRQLYDNDEVILSATLSAPQESTVPIPSMKVIKASKNTIAEPEQNTLNWLTINVNSGDNLTTLLKPYNISSKEIQLILQNPYAQKSLTQLHPGEKIHIILSQHNELEQLSYDLTPTQTLMLYKANNQYQSKIIHPQIETSSQYVSGAIERSLYQDASDAGANANVVAQMVDILKWDVDFAKDIRKGDRFDIIYEQQYRDGEKVGKDVIKAVEFTTQGKTYTAIRYQPPNGQISYFTPEGYGIRKAFMRAPVKYTRISDPFNLSRKHPILHTIRAHKGVDYAAPRGTPIHATADGQITFRGRKGGYGNAIVISHSNGYTTLYGHMSRFANKNGSRVHQGDVIGYVGSTGLATGPHVHYELRINGKPYDPSTIKSQNSAPIAKAYFADFKKYSNKVLAELNGNKSDQLAMTLAKADNESVSKTS